MIRRFGPWLLGAYFCLFAAITAGLAAYYQSYKSTPDQPIKFSHEIHAGKLQIACLDCHSFADKGRQASLPPVSKCMSCHTAVKTDSPEIIELTRHWNEKKPVEWSRIHKVSDFVYFSHKRHVKAGIACQSCHGQVEAIGYPMEQRRSLTMGFCVGCHRARGAPLDCTTCHK